MGAKARDLILTVLSTTATKREARQYVQRYNKEVTGAMRIALLRLSGRNNYASITPNLARTMAFMKELGAHPVVMLDSEPQRQGYVGPMPLHFHDYLQNLASQAERLSSYVSEDVRPLTVRTPFEQSCSEGLTARWDLLEQPLRQGRIPILLPMVFDKDVVDTKLYDTSKALKALVNGFNLRKDKYVMDKVICVDPLGGLPSLRRNNAAHVLVNLEQEFGEINAEIFSSQRMSLHDRKAHIDNLNTMREVLGILPASVSGIITTPQAAGLVLQRNPIIYNILTDRPLISPSLPVELHRTQLSTSLIRKGLSVYMLHSEQGLDLRRQAKVGNVNLTQLKGLIEDSFGRRIDLEKYLDRLKSNVAAVIVVGNYDGAAIVTWEIAPDGRKVAYLDKFAVHPKSQGAQGVADIMLIQMVRRLFRHEVIWRSRATNPVNKWYFERARGYIRIPNSEWIVFWICDEERPPLTDYVAICSSIVPSFIANE